MYKLTTIATIVMYNRASSCCLGDAYQVKGMNLFVPKNKEEYSFAQMPKSHIAGVKVFFGMYKDFL